jgi:hypothetical protein
VSEKEGGGFNYVHTLLWYKKKRGSALKALDAKSIRSEGIFLCMTLT